MGTLQNNSPYKDYLANGFTPLYCKGYNLRYNPDRDYKTAKEPAIKGWNSPGYVPPTLQGIEAWEKQGGWIGWLIPSGYIAIDNEEEAGWEFQDSIYKRKGIEPALHRTNKGYHDLFKEPEGITLSAQSEGYTRCGLKVTYRVGGKNYLILAPTDGRYWELWKPLEQLPVLPEELLPYDRRNIDRVCNCLAWQVGKAYRQGVFAGYHDIDAAFMAYLVQHGMSWERISRTFSLVFLKFYRPQRTQLMYERTLQKTKAGDPVIGAGSFIQKVKEHGLGEIERFTRELQALTLRDEKRESEPMNFTILGDLLQEEEETVSWLVEDMLPTGGFSIVAAKPKVGKSTFARNLALCVARGEPFLGRAVRQGQVIYLALEEKRSEVRNHFRDMGAQGDEKILVFASGVPKDALKQLREKTETLEPALIIVDPLFKFIRVKDGDAYAEMSQALEPLLRFARDTGAHVLCVHHTGKRDRQDADSILGSTAIFGTVDTAVILKRSNKYRTILTSQRCGPDLDETVLQFNSEARTVSMGREKVEEDTDSIERAIAEFLAGKENTHTEPEIMAEVEGNHALKRRALRSLVRSGKIDRTGKGSRGDPYKYSRTHVLSKIRVREYENRGG